MEERNSRLAQCQIRPFNGYPIQIWRNETSWWYATTYDLETLRNLNIVIDTVVLGFTNINESQRILFEDRLEIPESLTWFKLFFGELRDLLRVKRRPTGPAGRARKVASIPKFRYSSPGTESTMSNATDATGDSKESDKEHHTTALAKAFLQASVETLTKNLVNVAWFSTNYEFSVKLIPPPHESPLIIRGDQEMKLKLGDVEVEARSDGGINFFPHWGLKKYYPMLSLEVFLVLYGIKR